MPLRPLAVFFLLLLTSALAPAQTIQSRQVVPPSPILDRIRAARALTCAVAKEEEDYSRDEDHGNRAAFDLDLCKAVAVAILGPGAHFLIKPYPDETSSIQALQKGEVDLVASASHTLRSAGQGILFSRTVLHDGQGFLIKSSPEVHSGLDLAGKKICFVIETASESGLHEYADDHHISYIWYPFSEEGEMYAAFFGGNCAAITGDRTKLANIRGIARAKSVDYTILPTQISEDPLAIATLATDPRLAAIADWTIAILTDAEALGITSRTAKSLLTSDDPRVLHTLGQQYGPGTTLGLDPHWGANVIEAVGSYGEMFERDLGSGSPLRLDRGEDRLMRDGGLMTPVYP